MDEYGRTFVPPPPNAYEGLDVVHFKVTRDPTWIVQAPLWTAEEGRSDLEMALRVAIRDGATLVWLLGLLAP